MQLYLPSDYVDNYCLIVNNGYYRVYTNQSLTNYVDIYYNDHYTLKQGYSTYSYNGTCDTLYTYTDNYFYRHDITDILIITFIFLFINYFFISKLYKAFSRGRRLK